MTRLASLPPLICRDPRYPENGVYAETPPEIQAAGRAWLDAIVALLRARRKPINETPLSELQRLVTATEMTKAAAVNVVPMRLGWWVIEDTNSLIGWATRTRYGLDLHTEPRSRWLVDRERIINRLKGRHLMPGDEWKTWAKREAVRRS